MSSIHLKIGFLAAFLYSLTFSTSGMAQEIAASHLKAARAALTATHATASFDAILFNTSSKLKNDLTSKDPDKADLISTIVDEEAIALAPRRGDLENELARLFANNFTETELNEIGAFFSSEAGAKYLKATPILARELGKSAQIWANGIARDLAANAEKRMESATK